MSEARDAPKVDDNLEFQPIKFRREAAKDHGPGPKVFRPSNPGSKPWAWSSAAPR